MIDRVFDFLRRVNAYCCDAEYQRGGFNDQHCGRVRVTPVDVNGLLWHELGHWRQQTVAVESDLRWQRAAGELIMSRITTPGADYDELFRFDNSLVVVSSYYCGSDCYTPQLHFSGQCLSLRVNVVGPAKCGQLVTQYTVAERGYGALGGGRGP